MVKARLSDLATRHWILENVKREMRNALHAKPVAERGQELIAAYDSGYAQGALATWVVLAEMAGIEIGL